MRPIASQSPLVALESTVISHGLPYPHNLRLAPRLGEVLRGGSVTLDTGNFGWAGHGPSQVPADFAAVLPNVVSVHVKDGVWRAAAGGGPSVFQFVPAGSGPLPLADWLRVLAGRSYQGAVCSEYEGGGDFRDGTRASIAYLKTIS